MNSDDLQSMVGMIPPEELFYQRFVVFLNAVKLCYGGSGVKTYFLKHKDVQKFMLKKLHVESLELDSLFSKFDH